MTNTECEKAIAEKLKEIRKIYKDAYPEGNYLTLCICENSMWVNNSYYDADKDFPIEWRERLKWGNN